MFNLKKSLISLIFLNSFMQASTKSLPIQLFFKPKDQAEGDGARVSRIIGVSQMRSFDPFLMLDYFNVRLPAGFPDHPHRGFATLTYLLSGGMVHEDFKGHKGELGPGDVQVMTAGKGIIHAEMPSSFKEPAIGFQLWLNLKSANKYDDADYQEYKANEIPIVDKDGVRSKIVVGEHDGTQSLIKTKTPSSFIIFELKENLSVEKKVKKGWKTFIFVFEGRIKIDEKVYEENSAIFFEECMDENCVIKARSEGVSSKFLFVSGEPVNEPVFQYGPFVVASKEELTQTFEDYDQGKNGFENSRVWSSKIKDLKYKK